MIENFQFKDINFKLTDEADFFNLRHENNDCKVIYFKFFKEDDDISIEEFSQEIFTTAVGHLYFNSYFMDTYQEIHPIYFFDCDDIEYFMNEKFIIELTEKLLFNIYPEIMKRDFIERIKDTENNVKEFLNNYFINDKKCDFELYECDDFSSYLDNEKTNEEYKKIVKLSDRDDDDINPYYNDSINLGDLHNKFKYTYNYLKLNLKEKIDMVDSLKNEIKKLKEENQELWNKIEKLQNYIDLK